MIREAHESRSSLGIESKGSTADAENVVVDLVTATDKACEDYIISTLKAAHPDHSFIGEESSFAQGELLPSRCCPYARAVHQQRTLRPTVLRNN